MRTDGGHFFGFIGGNMRIGGVIFGMNAPAGLRRLAVVISVIVAFLWCMYFQDEVGDFLDLSPSDWLTFFIGLGAVALAAPLALGLYFSLPPLGADRRWEYRLLVIGGMTAIAFIGWMIVSEASSSGKSILAVIDRLLTKALFPIASLCLGIAVTPLVLVKVFVWLLKGTKQ